MGTIIPKMGIRTRPAGLAGALFSQVQLRVLSLFFGHPDRSYQLTEVIRLVGSGRGAVQRELEKLTNAGILDLSVVGSRKVYRANQESPIFDELYRLILKTVGLLEPIRNALKQFSSKIVVAFVYGSVARSQDTAKSDVDLMILGQDVAYSEIYAALQKAEKVIRREVNPSLMTLNEWKDRRADRNAFVTKILGQPKLFVFGTEDDLKGTRKSR
jgi:predicted nucleotidyltransferase